MGAIRKLVAGDNIAFEENVTLEQLKLKVTGLDVYAKGADLQIGDDPAKGAYGLVANAMARVDNVVALRALPPPTRKTVVYMEAYDVAGDGCGGALLWVPASTKADNGVTVFTPDTNPANGRWERGGDGTIPVEFAGARGDDATDNSAAFVRAEAAAFSLGMPISFAQGRKYRTSTSLTCRVSVIGNDAELRCTAAAQSLATGLLHFAAVTDITIRDLRINCNSTRRGLLVQGGTRVRITNVHVTAALFGGIAVYSGVDVGVENCSVDGSIYVLDGTGAGDGFYFHSGQNVRVTHCRAANFERIGFVSEGEVAGAKANNVVFTACVASNASNCDRSATEFNAAFWHENTNNCSYVNCVGVNISSGVGQASGRVRGFQAAVGADATCQVNYVNCQVIGNTTHIPFGFVCQGSALRPSVNYDNCFVQRCVVGLTSLGGIDRLSISDFKADLVNTAAGSQGAVTFDISANQLNELVIDGLEVTNRTYLADAADINFFTCHSGLRYRLSRAKRCTHVMRQAALSVSVDDSIIEYGSANYASFIATSELRFCSRFIGFLRAGAVRTNLWEGNQMAGATIYFDGSRLGSETATQVSQDCPGVDINIVATGATFDYLNLTVRMTGTYTHMFANCRMLNCNAATGFYASNPNAPLKQVLMVTGSRLEGVNAAATPLRKGTNNPTATVLQANTYNTTALHDFTAGVTAANNTFV